MHRILKRHGIRDIELLVNDLENENPIEIDLLIDNPDVLMSVWVYIYLQTIGKRKEIIVRSADSKLHRNGAKAAVPFMSTLEGLASVYNNLTIKTRTASEWDYSASEIKSHITGREYLECTELQSKRYTFVSWDPEFPFPRGMPQIRDFSNKDAFDQFAKWFDNILENIFPEKRVDNLKVTDSTQYSEHSNLFRRMVFEIYSNSFEHGRMAHHDDEQDSVICAPRFIRIGKVIGANAKNIYSRVKNFQELENYFVHNAKNGGRQYYVITVSDCGMGIVERFKSKTNNISDIEMDDLSLLNQIVEKGLSSKMGVPRSGEGLRRVCECLDITNAFLTIRTGKSWVYRLPSSDDRASGKDKQFCDVAMEEMHPKIVGTHVSIVVPLSV